MKDDSLYLLYHESFVINDKLIILQFWVHVNRLWRLFISSFYMVSVTWSPAVRYIIHLMYAGGSSCVGISGTF